MSTPKKYWEVVKKLYEDGSPTWDEIAAALHEAAKDAVRELLLVTASRSGAFWYVELHDDLDELQRWDHASTESEAIAARERLVEELTR